MKNIFGVTQFTFPYQYKFPGQASDEKILFVVRENKIMLTTRLVGVVLSSLAVVIVGFWLGHLVQPYTLALATGVQLLSVMVGFLFLVIGWWWVGTLWQKSLALITTKRLTKFIYTTPFNRHSLSLPLDQIVDTGSYTKGFLQAIFKLATFTARSSATSSGLATDDGARVNKKYFYIENIAIAEDLQHYVAKLLFAFRKYPDHLETFRPFVPHLKGDARKEFMQQYPQYWS